MKALLRGRHCDGRGVSQLLRRDFPVRRRRPLHLQTCSAKPAAMRSERAEGSVSKVKSRSSSGHWHLLRSDRLCQRAYAFGHLPNGVRVNISEALRPIPVKKWQAAGWASVEWRAGRPKRYWWSGGQESVIDLVRSPGDGDAGYCWCHQFPVTARESNQPEQLRPPDSADAFASNVAALHR